MIVDGFVDGVAVNRMVDEIVHELKFRIALGILKALRNLKV